MGDNFVIFPYGITYKALPSARLWWEARGASDMRSGAGGFIEKYGKPGTERLAQKVTGDPEIIGGVHLPLYSFCGSLFEL